MEAGDHGILNIDFACSGPAGAFDLVLRWCGPGLEPEPTRGRFKVELKLQRSDCGHDPGLLAPSSIRYSCMGHVECRSALEGLLYSPSASAADSRAGVQSEQNGRSQ
jgi:hypothetical protein